MWLYNTLTTPPTGTSGLRYIFGDTSAGAFRCFAAGAGGPGSILLRGRSTSATVRDNEFTFLPMSAAEG